MAGINFGLFIILGMCVLTAAIRPWMNTNESPATRAALLLTEMNTSEKIVMLHGPVTGDCCECNSSPLCNYTGNVAPNTRLGIPQIKMNDGPQGFRDNNHPGTSTSFPSALTVAASWDVELMFMWGKAMGEEFFAKGANVQLGPGMCLARVPQNGRNFEYVSGEDPFFGYTMVQPVIKGIQGEGVIANAKHYVLNNEETNRGTISDNADERTRFEMYYQPFQGAIDAGVGSMMCSYNKIYGTWSCENPETLAVDLKQRMGFEGFVMSDWGATHSTSIEAGLDIEMPSANYMGPALEALVASGKISVSTIDDSVLRILTPMFAMGLFDKPNPNSRSNNVTSPEHNNVCRILSSGSTVLLKNTPAVLPLNAQDPKLKIALIGAADSTCYTHSGGSGQVEPSRVVTPLQGITNALGDSSRITFNIGTDFAAAARVAAAADVAIVFVGATSSEGSDRKNLNLDNNGEGLIAAIAAAQANTVVVMSVPGAILTSSWSPAVSAILVNFMPGQEVGSAIADVLFGAVNPSAKLPITMPMTENDENFTDVQYPGIPPSNPIYANYTEGLFVGYRYYDKFGVYAAFPYGHGLSYTNFTYASLTISGRTVTFQLQNTGGVFGAEVPQLYIGFPASAGEPLRVLRGFTKVPLYPGQSMFVSFVLTDRHLSIWSVPSHAWEFVPGTYQVFVGASSRDFRLQAQATF